MSCPSRHPQDHHAYFGKWVELNPHFNELRIEYDWLSSIKFVLNGAVETSDDKWLGNILHEGLYSIRIILTSESIKSELVIFQELNKSEMINFQVAEMFEILSVVDLNKLLIKNIYDSIDIADNRGIILCGKDRNMVEKAEDYIVEHNNHNYIVFKDEFTEIELAHSMIICDPSIRPIDLTGVINAWLNGMPLLVNESSIIGDMCKITKSGLYFNNPEELMSCLDFLMNNRYECRAIGNNNRQMGIEIYNWLIFLSELKDYIDIRD